MAKFCFYIGQDIYLVDRLRRASIFCWGAVEERTLDAFHLFVASEDCTRSVHGTTALLGAISGYAEKLGGEPCPTGPGAFLSEISYKEWPLGNEWTGSFAAVAYALTEGEITLCNDLLGHWPLYYSRAGDGFIGGTSLIAISRTMRCETDAVGVLQRITVPFCNYGRRTVLRKVYRLLPGERLKWKSNSRGVHREYDDTICREVTEADLKKSARQVFDCLKSETTTALGHEKEFAVATSGGWDSRLILGAIPRRELVVHCLTYGGADLYETRIAGRCAQVIGASHECFPIEDKYFPSRLQIEELVKETESANYFEWFGIIEKARSLGTKPLLLLGDLCESVDGRYMTTFSTRKARINSYLGGMVGKREVFEEASESAFKRWCDEKALEIKSQLLANIKHLAPDLPGSLSQAQIASEIERDLGTSFARVGAQPLRYSSMYDEVFIWFHRIRFLLGNQINWLSSGFRPASPGLSMRFLRLITGVHPKHRVRKRLMNSIIALPEFDRLSRIPSAQIPFISSRAPAFIKDALWGLRSGADQILIKRNLKSRNVRGRQRVLRSIDYVREYRRESTSANVEDWFSGRFIKGDDYLGKLRARAELNAWTLINVDITAPANVSIILDLCNPETGQSVAQDNAAVAFRG